VDRARLLYQWYCETLPALLGCIPNRWRELDSFRFIPPVSHDQAMYVSRTIRDLELVSPREVLRAEHYSIAWTQRALFAPSSNLLVADLSLGVPDPVEVVSG